jgi:hypothetical protein
VVLFKEIHLKSIYSNRFKESHITNICSSFCLERKLNDQIHFVDLLNTQKKGSVLIRSRSGKTIIVIPQYP